MQEKYHEFRKVSYNSIHVPLCTFRLHASGEKGEAQAKDSVRTPEMTDLSSAATTENAVQSEVSGEAIAEQAPSGMTEADDPGYIDNTFTGDIRIHEKKHSSYISMQLKAQDGIVRGKYFYESNPNREDLLLEGYLNGDSLQLNELNAKGAITGRFIGKYITPTTIEGVWKNPRGTKEYAFSLETTDMSYEERKAVGVKADPE